ncbi:hypothetical protein HYV84_06155 [Candidatus Woesearchaeota archaeon]|nr:hypothetical protein [Candidatus Woesearchaeota archaeon]
MGLFSVHSQLRQPFDFRPLLEDSQMLVKINGEIEQAAQRLLGYLFSHRIKKILARLHEPDTQDILRKTASHLGWLCQQSFRLRDGAQQYYELVANAKHGFTQPKHYSLAKRFSYQGYQNAQQITARCEELKGIFSEKNIINSFSFENHSAAIRQSFGHILSIARDNNILFSDIRGRVQIEGNLIRQYEGLKKYILEPYQLETGDILLSFKPKEFFKKISFFTVLPRMTAAFEQSQVTHAALCIKLPGGPKIVESVMDIGIDGAVMRDFEVPEVQVLVALRPQLSQDQRMRLIQAIRRHIQNQPTYSVLKLVGFLPTLLVTRTLNWFTKGYRQLPNFLSIRKSTFFCSEFVNQVFKDAGILLTPKSKYSATVSPSDIVSSPFLTFIGLVFRDSERTEEAVTKYFEKSGLKI